MYQAFSYACYRENSGIEMVTNKLSSGFCGSSFREILYSVLGEEVDPEEG